MKKGSYIAGAVFTLLFAIAGGFFCFIGGTNAKMLFAVIGFVLTGLALIISSTTGTTSCWIAALITAAACFALKIISIYTIFEIPWIFVHGEPINIYFVAKVAFLVCVMIFFPAVIALSNNISDKEEWNK